jgi:hypothetical protein
VVSDRSRLDFSTFHMMAKQKKHLIDPRYNAQFKKIKFEKEKAKTGSKFMILDNRHSVKEFNKEHMI